MKILALALFAALNTFGCLVYADPPPVSYSTGCTTYCDSYGCRPVCGQYYTTHTGDVVYWDTHFNAWIGPHGYWRGGRWYHGYHPGYHGHYYGGHHRR